MGMIAGVMVSPVADQLPGRCRRREPSAVGIGLLDLYLLLRVRMSVPKVIGLSALLGLLFLGPSGLSPAPGSDFEQGGDCMVPSYEQVGDWLEEISGDFPDVFLRNWTEASSWRRRPSRSGVPAGEMYIMGEYCHDLLGRYIVLYYGSFSRPAGGGG